MLLSRCCFPRPLQVLRYSALLACSHREVLHYSSCSSLPQVVNRNHTLRKLRSITPRATSPLAPPRRLSARGIHDLGDELGSTIYALSTAAGQAAIAVIRISGPEARAVYHALTYDPALPRPRTAAVRTLFSPDRPPSQDTILDINALVLYFPSPRSATGEDVLELHVHGGTATVRAVLNAIPACSKTRNGIRYAEPGEFTRRAFFNDRLDLIQVEALSDGLAAVTEQQRRLSVRGSSSRLGQQFQAWREMLLSARGELEALIDFSEDQHFDESPAELIGNVARQVQELGITLQVHARNALRGELLRSGISVALLGAPNAGKSSLLNRIVGREAAIVSRTAGTTRDVVEVSMDIGGYLCRFADTAGLRRALQMTGGDVATSPDTIGDVEEEGMKRARVRAEESDLVIVVVSFEPSDDDAAAEKCLLRLDREVSETAERLLKSGRNVLLLVNKVDRQPSSVTHDMVRDIVQHTIPSIERQSIHFATCNLVQAGHVDNGEVQIDDGIPQFLGSLISKFGEMTQAIAMPDAGSNGAVPTPHGRNGHDTSVWQESLGATERQRVLLQECASHLDGFLQIARQSPEHRSFDVVQTEHRVQVAAAEDTADVDLVLAAEHLRNAAYCLAKITGKGEAGDVEEVLGVVFERFCVGK